MFISSMLCDEDSLDIDRLYDGLSGIDDNMPMLDLNAAAFHDPFSFNETIQLSDWDVTQTDPAVYSFVGDLLDTRPIASDDLDEFIKTKKARVEPKLKRSKTSVPKISNKFSDIETEATYRMNYKNKDRISRMVQLTHERYGGDWVPKEVLMSIASEVGYSGKNTTLKGNMWYLKNSRFGDNRVATGDPFGKYFPYWLERRSQKDEHCLRLSPHFFSDGVPSPTTTTKVFDFSAAASGFNTGDDFFTSVMGNSASPPPFIMTDEQMFDAYNSVFDGALFDFPPCDGDSPSTPVSGLFLNIPYNFVEPVGLDPIVSAEDASVRMPLPVVASPAASVHMPLPVAPAASPVHMPLPVVVAAPAAPVCMPLPVVAEAAPIAAATIQSFNIADLMKNLGGAIAEAERTAKSVSAILKM